jgi:hypothetical protein
VRPAALVLLVLACASDAPERPAALTPGQVVLVNCIAGVEMGRKSLGAEQADAAGLCREALGRLATETAYLYRRPEASGCAVGVTAIYAATGHGAELSPPSPRASLALQRCEALP